MENSLLFVDVMRHGNVSLDTADLITHKRVPDLRLNKEGVRKIRAVAKEIQDKQIKYGQIISSPTPRALDSAKIIAEITGAHLVIMDELREVKPPEGDDLVRLFDTEGKWQYKWVEGWPGFEDIKLFLMRTEMAAAKIFEYVLSIYRPVLVVAHEETAWGFDSLTMKIPFTKAIKKELDYARSLHIKLI